MVKVNATMVESCPGISTAVTVSSEPEACGLARFTNEAIRTTTNTAPMVISTILAGGRFFFAVPYSSPMLMVGPAGTAGGAGGLGGGGGAAVSSGIRLCGTSPDSTPDQVESSLEPAGSLAKS